MTRQELRSSGSLALIFALRMLGLFLVLPVFALEAQHYAGGNDPAMVGLALGMYGLTQAVFQLPLGLASDRFGRKKVIIVGLLVFALGSLVAALADSLMGLVWGRALQGAGAVSAAVTALLADLTRDSVRTKAMAMVGGSIALMFSLALVLSPLLAGWVGLSGIFWITLALTLAGIAAVLWVVPPEPVQHTAMPRGRFADLLAYPDLLRLNVGVFVLHTVQMAMWVAVPTLLVQAGLVKTAHWQVYLPAVLLSFAALGRLFAMERKGQLRSALLLAIVLVLLVQAGLGALTLAGDAPSLWLLGAAMLVFFIGFNMLEATQPSLVSRMAPDRLRGAALGAYNTLQSLGLFAGGFLGGWLSRHGSLTGVFAATALLCVVWLVVTWPLQPIGRNADKTT
ncbi:MAG TPA: MFS transporter [Comamonas denitrificans]|nr:MFS transporter [Comamonas denitrificans]HRL96538.1 MFS transporter [Comamonas denitrificans]HRN31183.1 MFS transporter [Comamonas denitrificans]